MDLTEAEDIKKRWQEYQNGLPCPPSGDLPNRGVLSLAQTHRGRPQTTSTRLHAGGELQGTKSWNQLE